MIYEDIHNFSMYHSSAKEVDVLLYIINNTDWNNCVEINTYDLANKIGTTNKYAKELLKKLSSNLKRKQVIKKISDDGLFQKYKFLLGKSPILYNKSDKYGRKFKFLYESKFQGLSIYAKRIVLDAVMKTSITNQNIIYTEVDRYLNSTELFSGLIPNKNILNTTIDELSKNFSQIANIDIVKRKENNKSYIRVVFNEIKLEDVLINNTEEKALKRALFEYGYFGELSKNQNVELLKVGSYIFNSIYELTRSAAKKFNTASDLFELSFDMARDIYNKSLQKLVGKISKNFDNKDPKELSAYFSTIVFETISEKMINTKTKLEMKIDLLNNYSSKYKLEEEDLGEEYKLEKVIFSILENWRNNWLKPRIDKGGTEHFYENENALAHISNLKEFLIETSSLLKNKVSKEIANISIKEKIFSLIDNYRDDPLVYLEINEERLLEKHSLINAF